MKKQISILGCGWLGEPLAIYLNQLGYSIKGSTTSDNKLQKLEDLQIIPFLISLESLPHNIMKFLNSEILVIALPSKNCEGFRNLISQIVKSTIKKVIFISSTSVYSSQNQLVTEETHLESSVLAEIEQLFTNNIEFKTTIIRFAGLFGYNRKPGDFFKNKKIILNPEGFVNMIHRDDSIEIISQIIKKEIWGEIFNGCTDTHPSRREYYIKASLTLGHDFPVFEEAATSKYKIVCNKKLKKMLNFKFKYSDLLGEF